MVNVGLLQQPGRNSSLNLDRLHWHSRLKKGKHVLPEISTGRRHITGRLDTVIATTEQKEKLRG